LEKKNGFHSIGESLLRDEKNVLRRQNMALWLKFRDDEKRNVFVSYQTENNLNLIFTTLIFFSTGRPV
jgi:hypothetical protein